MVDTAIKCLRGSPDTGTVPFMPLDLSKDRKLAVSFTKAGAAVEAHRLAGRRCPVYLVIDFSGSMRKFFNDGHVQRLAEQILALAAHFDDDGVVQVWFFDDGVRHPVNVSVRDYEGSIERIRKAAGRMGGTSYAPVIRSVRDYHRAHNPGQPALVVFQTDGSPNAGAARRASTDELCMAAYEPIFWQFIGFGSEGDVLPGEGARFDYMRLLDGGLPVPEKRPVDNAGFFPAGPNPAGMDEDVLYNNLLAEFPTWLEAYQQRFGQFR